MKAISKTAKKVMDTLTRDVKGAKRHKKIDNTEGTFMPVHIEQVGRCDLGQIFSVAHYYIQEGDKMRDPDMEFIKGEDGNYYPTSFWQDAPLKRDDAVEWKDGEIAGIRPKLQVQLATFANTWMKNIAFQQGL